MAISGYNSVPLGVAGSGSAVILRGGDAALGILQQGQRARELRAQREALQRQKDALALSKQLSEDRRLGLDTGGAFQEPFNNSVAGVQDYFTDQYKQLQAGQISQLQLSQNIANKKNEVERERLLGVDKDKLIAGYETAQSANKYRDKEGLHTALGETLLGADGSRVRASQYDERGTLQKLDADARTYNPEPIIADYFAKQQASTLEDAAAGRIGGLHSSSSVTYKGYTPVRRADGQWDVKRGANGLPELKTTEAELATERSRNHELNMAVSRLELEEGKAAKAEGRQPRAAIDLYRQAAGKYASFRQNESVGLNAQPRAARAGAKGAAEVPYSPPTFDGAEVRYNLPTPEIQSQPFSLPGVSGMEPIASYNANVETQRPDHAVYGSVQAPPIKVDKQGNRTNQHVDSFVPDDYTSVGSDGKRQLHKYNRQPLAGSPGNSYGAFVDNEGKELFFKTTKEGEDAVRAGKASLRVKFDFNQDKDENFAANLQETTAALLKEKNSDYKPKYATRDLAEAEARKRLKGGTVRTTHLYTPENFKVIDGLFGDSYSKHQKALDEQTLRLRAQGPAAKKVVDWGTGKTAPKGAVINGIKTTGGKNVITW